jgi:hypothetical protein
MASHIAVPQDRPEEAAAASERDVEATAASIHALYEPTRRAFIEVYRHELVS